MLLLQGLICITYLPVFVSLPTHTIYIHAGVNYMKYDTKFYVIKAVAIKQITDMIKLYLSKFIVYTQ